MKQNVIFASILALVMGCVTLSSAQTRSPKIDKKERRQEERIRKGERSGEITPKEASKLETRENRIRNEKRVDKADGKLSRSERRQIRRDEHRADKQIYDKKHNSSKL